MINFDDEARRVAAAFGVPEFTQSLVEDGEDGHWCYFEGQMTAEPLCRWGFSLAEKQLLGGAIGNSPDQDEICEVYFDGEGFLAGKYQRREDAWKSLCGSHLRSQQMAKALYRLGWEAELIERLTATLITPNQHSHLGERMPPSFWPNQWRRKVDADFDLEVERIANAFNAVVTSKYRGFFGDMEAEFSLPGLRLYFKVGDVLLQAGEPGSEITLEISHDRVEDDLDDLLLQVSHEVAVFKGGYFTDAPVPDEWVNILWSGLTKLGLLEWRENLLHHFAVSAHQCLEWSLQDKENEQKPHPPTPIN